MSSVHLHAFRKSLPERLLRKLQTLLCLLICSCAGNQGPTASAESVATSTRSAEAVEPERSSRAGGDGAPDEKSTPPNASTLEDVQAVLQLVLDDEALQPYLRLHEPGRIPLKIAKRNLPAGIQLTKATEPVELVDAVTDEQNAVLVFREVQVSPSQASVRYRYEIEGLRGSATLEKSEGRWQLVRSRINQY